MSSEVLIELVTRLCSLVTLNLLINQQSYPVACNGYSCW